jgi:hypothetical protein
MSVQIELKGNVSGIIFIKEQVLRYPALFIKLKGRLFILEIKKRAATAAQIIKN